MSRRHALPLAGALLLANACSPAVTSEAPAVVAQPAAVAAEAPPAPPARITAGAMPGDAQFYAEVTGVTGLLASARSVVGDAAFLEARAAIAREAGLSEKVVERFFEAIESMHLGGKKIDGEVRAAVTVVFRDGAPMRDIIASGVLVDAGAFGPHGRQLKPRAGGKDSFVWFDGPRLLLTGDDPMVAVVGAVVEGRAPGLRDEARAAAALAPGERRVADAFIAPSLLSDLVAGKVSFPSPLTVAFGIWEGGLRGAYRASLAAQNIRANLPVPPPRALSLAQRLPAETAGYLALSTGLPGGRSAATQLLAQIVANGGPEAARVTDQIDGVLAAAGLRLVDLVGTLGDEGVIGVSVKPGVKSTKELEESYAVVIVQELHDSKPAEALLKFAREKISAQKKKFKLRAEGTGFSADLLGGSPLPFLRARISGGRLFIGVGQKDLVEHATLAVEKGKGTLAVDAAHTRALTGLPAASQLRLWFDLGRSAELAAAAAAPSQQAALEVWKSVSTGPKRVTSGLAFTATPDDDRVRFALDEVNGVGVFAALGIFGVRRYLARAKSAEAKNTIGAISRAAVAAFEREAVGPNNTVLHQICKSAQPVPSAVPRAVKYQSSQDPGRDWNSGDQLTGWRCLKMSVSEPQYYQYTYIAGGPYKGPKRGGPDPGPNGFEVAAEGDLNGDGVTSLFTRTGTVDPQTGMVKLSTELWVDKEME